MKFQLSDEPRNEAPTACAVIPCIFTPHLRQKTRCWFLCYVGLRAVDMQGEGAAAPVPLHPLPCQGSFWRRQPMFATAPDTESQLT